MADAVIDPGQYGEAFAEEARTALRSLLGRCSGLALDGPPGPRVPGMPMRGFRSLRIRW
ncbi:MULTISPECIES: hypothetical protein [Streptomyces]|uniref:hypothetical protein n=1 Tax=Streptomyces TaxID=1883 RepID=UPI0035A9A8D5|nr:hypothetical protein [Streptomyces sp. MH192]MCF0102598.1 hypothetical protein [Streptomyces sp. MH191]